MRRGQRPVVRVQHRFEWLYLLAFVHPASRRSEWQFASSINTAVMNVALEAFARAVGAGPSRRIVLVLDQAGYHVSPLANSRLTRDSGRKRASAMAAYSTGSLAFA